MAIYNRYSSLSSVTDIVPYIRIAESTTDQVIKYKAGKTRFDRLSNDYYGSPDYWWLIMLANPQYTIEFDIEEGALIRVPFPLSKVYENYINEVSLYNKL